MIRNLQQPFRVWTGVAHADAYLGHVLLALDTQQVHDDILVTQVLKAGADPHLILQLRLGKEITAG